MQLSKNGHASLANSTKISSQIVKYLS
uniref:Uncharacterized protein n=1 Tax=Anguilla anguilla TaxID=7936 RepID=A0A0E9Q4X4_ANGAN